MLIKGSEAWPQALNNDLDLVKKYSAGRRSSMTDNKTSGSTSNRSRSSRTPVVIDQEPVSSSMEEQATQSAEPIDEAIVTPDVSPDDEPIETASKDTAETVVAPSKRSGIGVLVLAIVAGAAAGAAVNGLMPVIFPESNDLAKRLTTIEHSIVSVPRQTEVNALVQPLDDLRRQNAVLSERLIALEERMTTNASGTNQEHGFSGEAAAELTVLQGRVGRIDEVIAGIGRELATTTNQVRAMEEAVSAQDSAQVQSEQKAISGRLSELETIVRAKLGDFDPASMASRIDAHATELARLGGRLKATEDELLAVERKAMAAEASNNERLVLVARLAVLERLGQALEQGKPFSNEVDTLAKLGVSASSLSALQAAENGIATPQSLLESFTRIAAGFEVAAMPADASFMDKLAASAVDLVRIRRIDAAPDASDLAGQIEALLKSNDASAAFAVWEHLPQSARDQSRTVADALQMRIHAQAALAALIQNQIHALGMTAMAGSSKGE